jgi:hypothetical protein
MMVVLEVVMVTLTMVRKEAVMTMMMLVLVLMIITLIFLNILKQSIKYSIKISDKILNKMKERKWTYRLSIPNRSKIGGNWRLGVPFPDVLKELFSFIVFWWSWNQ